MIEPTSMTAASVAATLSGITLAMLGVDYYALLGGLVGAMLAMGQAAPMTRARAVLYVVLSAIAGAMLGHGAVTLAGNTARPMLIICSLVAGAGAQALIAALIGAAIERIKKAGGQP